MSGAISTALARATFALALRASRTDGLGSGLARRLVAWVLRFDFDLDPEVRADQGYQLDELHRYESGPSRMSGFTLLPSAPAPLNADSAIPSGSATAHTQSTPHTPSA